MVNTQERSCNIVELIRVGRIKCLGHLIRMTECRIPQKIFLSTMFGTRRK